MKIDTKIASVYFFIRLLYAIALLNPCPCSRKKKVANIRNDDYANHQHKLL